MLFPTRLTALSALLATASAVDMQAFQGTGCDNGASVYWTNVAAYNCVTIPLSFGFRFLGMPGGAQGQAYYDSHCTNFAQAGGSGTYCLDAHNNMRSANWFWVSKKLVRSETDLAETTTGAQYTLPDGTLKRILVDEAEFEHVMDLAAAANWDALSKYPTGEFESWPVGESVRGFADRVIRYWPRSDAGLDGGFVLPYGGGDDY